MKHIRLFERNERLSMYDLITLSEKDSALVLIDALEGFDTDDNYIKDIFKYCTIDVNYRGQWKSTPLMIAAYENKLFALKELLKYPNIQVNAKDENMLTALMYACDANNVEIVEELLKHPELKINEKDKYQKTALLYALDNDNVEIVRLLLNNPSINISVKDNEGKGAWGYAGKKCRDEFPELKFDFEWEESENSLSRVFTFKYFYHAIQFIDRVAEISEEIDHHPDIHLFDYNNVRITYTTHDEGKVTEKDYEASRLVDEEYRNMS